MNHDLKCVEPHFDDIASGVKSCEVRLNDRNFQVGDFLTLREWHPETEYSGRIEERRISHVLRDFPGLAPGWVALSIFNPYP